MMDESTTRCLVALIFAPAFAIALGAFANEAYGGGSGGYGIEYRIEYNPHDDNEPVFTFPAPLSLGDVEVVLERDDGHRQSEKLGSLAAGETGQIAIEQPSTTSTYEASIRGVGSDGQTYDFQLHNITVQVTQALAGEFLVDQIDFDAGQVPVRVNRPVESLEFEITDRDGNTIDKGRSSLDGARGQIEVDWEPDGAAVGSVEVTLRTGDGSWWTHRHRFFSVELPQQLINFETGSATIEEDQQQKLKTTARRINETVQKYEEYESEIQLFVVGYTDTVGAASDNLELSRRRARSLATWFRDHGIDIPIYYQGFGQEVLAVETPDQTEERRNRRALYVVGNTPPPTSEDIPRSQWQRLP